MVPQSSSYSQRARTQADQFDLLDNAHVLRQWQAEGSRWTVPVRVMLETVDLRPAQAVDALSPSEAP